MVNKTILIKIGPKFPISNKINKAIHNEIGQPLNITNSSLFLIIKHNKTNKATCIIVENDPCRTSCQYRQLTFLLTVLGIQQNHLNHLGVLVSDCQ